MRARLKNALHLPRDLGEGLGVPPLGGLVPSLGVPPLGGILPSLGVPPSGGLLSSLGVVCLRLKSPRFLPFGLSFPSRKTHRKRLRPRSILVTYMFQAVDLAAF